MPLTLPPGLAIPTDIVANFMESTAIQSPRVSVIMPAYMTAHLIADALNSVFSQTFQDFEILVVNDGSPDTVQLESVLARYPERIVYIKQENKRAAGARNTAIRHARSEFLAFLDSDDVWLPDHLAQQMQLFEEDPAREIVYCNGLQEVRGVVREVMDLYPSSGTADFEALVAERCQLPVSTVVARKQALARAGFFDESLPRCDDYDMWLRAAFWGAKIGYSRKPQVRFSGSRPGSLSTSSVKMTEAYMNILEKALRTLPLDDKRKDMVEQRAGEIRAQYLLEQGKVHLREGRVSEAAAMLAESNKRFQRRKLSLILLGLRIAPGATRRLTALAQTLRRRRPA